MHDRLWGNNIAGASGLFLLASAVYIWGLSPTIYWYDSPEFVTTAYTLDISHPAGSPTYSLGAKLITFLPIGSIALRVNAFSALAGALSVALLFALLDRLLAAALPWVRTSAALSGALFLFVSESFWLFAEVAEVYTLQSCSIVLLLLVLLKARTCAQPVQMRYHWLFAFLYGLSAGVHATMGFCVPAFLGFIGLTAPRTLRSKGLAFLAFFFLLGFAVYLYLPIRSLTELAFNWGHPQTLHSFLYHITDRKDAAVHTVFFWGQLPHQVYMYLVYVSNEFSTLGALLGLLGLMYILYTDKPLWFLLIFVFLGNVLFFIRIWWDTAWGFIPSFVIFALWSGFGVYACLTFLVRLYQRRTIRIPRVAIYAFLFGGIAITLGESFARHHPIANQAENYSTALYGKQLLEQLPADAILFCHYSWFPLLYLQQVEQWRPDLTFILQGEIFMPRYFSFISKKRFPNIRLVTSDTPVVLSNLEYFWRLSRLNEPEHPLFWDPDGQYQQYLADYLLPRGLLFAFTPDARVDITPDILRTHWQLLSRSINRILQGALEDSTTFFLADKLSLIASYLKRTGLAGEAEKTYQEALSIRPQEPSVRTSYGALLVSQRRLPEALEQFNEAYSQDPIHVVHNKNLGDVLLRLGDNAQAAYFLERASSFGPANGDTYAQLGEAYAKLGRLPEALRALQTALKLLTESAAQGTAGDRSQDKITWVQELINRIEAGRSTASPKSPSP